MKRALIIKMVIIMMVFGFISCASSEKQKKDDEFSFGSADQIGGQGTKTETAEGMAEVRSAGKDEAYDRAIENALRKCIEQALGTIIDARILGESGVILEENIYAKKQGYIKKYEIKSKKIDDGVAYVTVTAVVGLQKLKDDVMALDIMQHRMSMPKVIIFINEKNLGQESKQNASYNVLVKKFTEKKFTIISPSDVGAEYKKLISGLYSSIEGDENEFISAAGKLGTEVNADVVIVGKGFSKEAEGALSAYSTQMKSFQADMDFKVVNVGDGRIIATSTKHGAAVHINNATGGINAIQKASEMAADDLVNQILTAWEDILNNGNLITLYASGLTLTAELKFSKDLKSYFREVKEVYSKQKKGNQSVFTVKFLGTPRDLATALTTKETFPYQVNVLKYDFGLVSVSVVNK
ncbi:MAG: hypothetical protein PHF84_00330 [bacterium]|nr:hypothetical protein [bacterium]